MGGIHQIVSQPNDVCCTGMKASKKIIEGCDRSPEAVVGQHQERSLINVLLMQVECRFPAAEVIPLVASNHDGGASLAQLMERSRVPTQATGRRNKDHISKSSVFVDQGKKVVPDSVVSRKMRKNNDRTFGVGLEVSVPPVHQHCVINRPLCLWGMSPGLIAIAVGVDVMTGEMVPSRELPGVSGSQVT